MIMRKIPGPDIKFLLGTALEFTGTPEETFKIARIGLSKWEEFARYWAFNIGAINLTHPDYIEEIISTTKHNDKSRLYDCMRPWLQDGLLVSSGDKWQQRRKILTPAFHFNILQKFFVTVEENSRRLVDSLSGSAAEKVDLIPLMHEFTLNIICETAMDVRFSEEMADKGKMYKAAILTIGQSLVLRASNLILYIDFVFKRSFAGRKQKQAIEIVQNFTKKVIRQRKEYIEKNGLVIMDDNNEYTMNNKKKTAFLDLLIQAHKDNLIDDHGIQEEVDTFMFGGHDTTACGLIYCFMLIANHKDVQGKIYDELRTIFGDSDRKMCYDDLSNMRYLERCIKESLRLYPPVSLIGRQIHEPTTIGEYKTPSDLNCHIHIYDLHRRPELFPDPLKFDPDRFLPENCVGRHPYAYIPFSAGPRNCIGQKFAMMEMKAAVAAVLRRFELRPVTHPNEMQFISDLVLRTNHPVYVSFIKRK